MTTTHSPNRFRLPVPTCEVGREWAASATAAMPVNREPIKGTVTIAKMADAAVTVAKKPINRATGRE